MNFYKFINSKDIRTHLENIGYEFGPLEAAFIVWQSKTATIEEKHAAWREIINTMPDTDIPYEKWQAPRESLHAFLRDYMALEDRLLAEFFDLGNLAFYNYYSPEHYYTDIFVDNRGIYYDLDACLTDALDGYDVPLVFLYRLDLTNGNRLRVAFNRKRQAVKITPEFSLRMTDERVFRESFLELSFIKPFPFSVPLPFQTGDILCEYDFFGDYSVYRGTGYADCCEYLNKEKVTGEELKFVPQKVLDESRL